MVKVWLMNHKGHSCLAVQQGELSWTEDDNAEVSVDIARKTALEYASRCFMIIDEHRKKLVRPEEVHDDIVLVPPILGG